MAYTLKTQQIAVKDPDTGTYSGVDVLTEQTKSGLLAEIQAEGAAQRTSVTNTGAAQVSAVQAKGTETLASIPSDYTTLSNDVDDLKNTFSANQITNLRNNKVVITPTTKNLFNPDAVEYGCYYDSGVRVKDPVHATTGYIDVSGLSSIHASAKQISSGSYIGLPFYFLNEYDENYNYVGFSNSSSANYSVGSGVKYVRFDFSPSLYQDIQVESGTSRTGYVAFDYKTSLKNGDYVPTSELDMNKIDYLQDNVSTVRTSSQLFNKEEAETGVYYERGVPGTSANAVSTPLINVSGMTAVNAGGYNLSDQWKGVPLWYLNTYDENGDYVGFRNTENAIYEVETGIAFIRFTIFTNSFDYETVTVVEGTARANDYIPYSTKTTFSGTISSWAGKLWACMGDSLTEENARSSKFYHQYIAEKTGISVRNLGVSGTGYRRGIDSATPNSFYNRVSTIPNNCDVFTIFGSFNDLGGGQTLGTIDDTISDDTIFGYVNATIDKIYELYPTINIGIISPTPWKEARPGNPDNSYTKYAEGLKQICYNRGIPFLDLYHCSNLRPWDATARDLFYSKDVDGGVNSGVHPDERGHAMIAPKFEAFLDSLLLR